MRRCFKLGSTATKFNLSDVVKKKFRYAYGSLDIEQTTDKSSEQCTKIDDCWLKV